MTERRNLYEEPKLVVIERLTGVPLPFTLDMREHDGVIGLLSALIEEEAKSNQNYYGAIIYGSLSRGRAHNGSDIDIFHIVENDWSQSMPIRNRLDTVLRLYKPPYVTCPHPTFDSLTIKASQLRDAEENARELEELKLHRGLFLDRDSIVVVPDEEMKERVLRLLDFKDKKPFRGKRPFKRRKKPYYSRLFLNRRFLEYS